MKLSLLQENLNLALSSVSRFTTIKSQLPILSHILFSTDNGRLKLSATNLEVGINYWLGAKIDAEGSITVPARDITEFVSYLPPGKIDLFLNDQNLLSLSTPSSQSTFASTPPADYPQLASLDPASALSADLPSLQSAINQIAFSAASDDTRPVLTAVLTRFDQNNLTLVATDGFRLSHKTIVLSKSAEPKPDNPQTYLIPARSLNEIAKINQPSASFKIGQTPDGHQLVFVFDDLQIISRLIEGDYPDFTRIIPESFATTLTLSKAELAKAIKIASVFARQSANVVKFSVTEKSLTLTANAPQVGQNHVSLPAKTEGPPLEIAFNYKFVADFLSVCPGDQITLDLNQSLTPAMFKDTSLSDYFHIIMPVRLQD